VLKHINPPKLEKINQSANGQRQRLNTTPLVGALVRHNSPQAVEPSELDRSLGCCIRGQKPQRN